MRYALAHNLSLADARYQLFQERMQRADREREQRLAAIDDERRGRRNERLCGTSPTDADGRPALLVEPRLMGRFTEFRRSQRGEGRLVRSDNLRTAPRWITPDLVGKLLDLSMPPGVGIVAVETFPTRGIAPELAIVPKSAAPDEHARRAEEREAAACPPASPPKAKVGRYANKLSLAEQPEFQRLARIAHDRGIAVIDLTHVVGRPVETVLKATRDLGYAFGKRPPLAERLTRKQLFALADRDVPLPELRADRLKRERLERWAKYKRDKRADRLALQAEERARVRAEREAAEAREKESRRQTREQARRDRADAAEREKEERRIAREQLKAARTSATTSHCGVEKEAVCRPVVPSPSREPAPILPPARAQTITVRPTPGAARHVNYAERMRAATEYLRARHFTVRRHNPDEIIGRWHVLGYVGLFSNEELIELAVHHGLEFAQ